MNRIFNNIEITEDDIRYAEEILFGKSNVFDKEERIPIIENFNKSFDVNACPGSGKTTVLLAKLIILSRKMPLNNGQGICVLTHTNVAIDEIKSKLGDKSDILFKYPNYFGTIQKFIDKYLAIPYFKRKNNENIKSIDDDIYYDYIRKLSKEKYFNIYKTIQFYIDNNYGNYINGSNEKNFITFISNKHFDIRNEDIRDNNNKLLSKNSYYSELKDIMLDKTLNNGVFRYEDAYFLAGLYIKKFPQIKKYFANRFKYIFIDEMQDVSKIQIEIIESIFSSEDNVIIQRFGDINQRISRFDSSNNWKLSEDTRTINSSKRYGENMIKFLEPLRVKKIGTMKGNKNINTLNPHIIVFDDLSIEKVVSKYVDLLNEYNIKEEGNKKIKIIGKIGIQVNEPNKSISSYIKEYKPKRNKNISINKKIINNLIKSSDIKNFYDYLISIILLSIEIDRQKVTKEKFNKMMQEEYIEEFIKFKSYIVSWFKDFKFNTDKILEDIFKKIKELFDNIEEINYNEKLLKNKLNNIGIESNKTKLSNDIINLDNVDTIMSTKGETHIATLYLESKLDSPKNRNFSDISRILDYMFNKEKDINEDDEDALMNAYVAMSRAEKLTCIAIQYDTIKGKIKNLKEYGYEIFGCSEEINLLIENEL